VKNQFFLSSTQRFTNPILQANRIYTAPGDYNPLTSDFDKLQLKVTCYALVVIIVVVGRYAPCAYDHSFTHCAPTPPRTLLPYYCFHPPAHVCIRS